jgi:uncharacterized protein
MKNFDVLGWWLLVVGALNWGLVGLGNLLNLGNLNLVNLVLGSVPVLESLVYVLVGLAGLMSLYNHVSKKR